MKKLAFAALLISAPVLASMATSANACGYYGEPCMRMPVPGTPVYAPAAAPAFAPAFGPGPSPRLSRGPAYAPGYDPAGNPIFSQPVGRWVGAAAGAGMQSIGVPAPVAAWAGERIGQNWQSAAREETLGAVALRTGVGISVRDIQERGPLGGDGSEARKLCNGIVGIFGGKC